MPCTIKSRPVPLSIGCWCRPEKRIQPPPIPSVCKTYRPRLPVRDLGGSDNTLPRFRRPTEPGRFRCCADAGVASARFPSTRSSFEIFVCGVPACGTPKSWAAADAESAPASRLDAPKRMRTGRRPMGQTRQTPVLERRLPDGRLSAKGGSRKADRWTGDRKGWTMLANLCTEGKSQRRSMSS